MTYSARFVVFLGLMLLFCSASAKYGFTESGESRSGGKVDLGQIVVSATRGEISRFDAPQNITVLTKQEIMGSPFSRVEDIVRDAAGLHNFRHYGLQTNGIVSPLIMRGAGKNRVLILADGVPQNDNFNNAIAWVAWGHIPKDVIERIEIVRGPASALYGSEALGGVIHIITKKPDAERKTAVQGSLGNAHTYDVRGFHNQTFKDLGLILSGGCDRSSGFYMTNDIEDYNIRRYRDVGKVFGKLTYDIDPESSVDLSTLMYMHETGKGRKFFYDRMTLLQNTLSFTHQNEHFGVKGILYLNYADKTAYQDSASDNHASLNRKEKMPWINTWGGDFQLNVPYGECMDVVLGSAYRMASWEYDEDYVLSMRDAGARGTQHFIAPFANVKFSFWDDKMIADLGARYDWTVTADGRIWDTTPSAGKTAYDLSYGTRTSGSFAPKAGLVFHPDEKTAIRASGGKGFRAPSLFELFKVHTRSGGRYYRAANPELDPEDMWSYDVGVERLVFDDLTAKATFYQSFADDFIGDRLTKSYTKKGKVYNEYVLDNINQVKIHGIETEFQWFILKELALWGNYTFNISKISEDENAESLKNKYLPDDPRHRLHLGVRYKNPRVANISLTSNYYSTIYYDNENTLGSGGYWTFDFSVSRKLFDHLTLFLTIENMFDKEYPILRSSTSADTTAPGFILDSGLRLEF